jgi:hypothetical protein
VLKFDLEKLIVWTHKDLLSLPANSVVDIVMLDAAAFLVQVIAGAVAATFVGTNIKVTIRTEFVVPSTS